MNRKYYVTTPIYYVNDRPHIGHVYTTTIADVVARYHRLDGDDVFFLTGTDEHAAKVVDAAAALGISPQECADRNSQAYRDTFAKHGMSNDDFVRTTESRHVARVERYVKQLMDSGDVYQGEYEGWYDAGQEEYVTENKAKESDYRSAVNGKPLVRKREKNYFFRLSRYADRLLELLDSGEEFELLLTLAPDHPALNEENLDGDGPLSVIGHVSAGQAEVILQEGSVLRSIQPGGWSHRNSDRGEG